MNSYLKGLLCCLLATVSWGGMFPVMTHALTYIDPFNFTTFRYGIAGIAFALLLLFREGQNSFVNIDIYIRNYDIGYLC
ncbi:EamA family transporter, partial [Salmonella enterica]|uniref:EamA family transporter n=1 Tax=Salmonella enterica TaxID=28901 RepID=UPI0011173CE9